MQYSYDVIPARLRAQSVTPHLILTGTVVFIDLIRHLFLCMVFQPFLGLPALLPLIVRANASFGEAPGAINQRSPTLLEPVQIAGSILDFVDGAPVLAVDHLVYLVDDQALFLEDAT